VIRHLPTLFSTTRDGLEALSCIPFGSKLSASNAMTVEAALSIVSAAER
jgi:hypothetical protein